MQDEKTTSQPTIECYLNTFKEIIKSLNTSDNLAIGGYQALKLHGLTLNRQPSDLDIIIFQPTPRQLATLKVLQCFDCIKRPRDVDFEHIKVFKFKKHDMFMDVIIAKEYIGPLLSFNYEGGSFKVNSIFEVIRAKASYKSRRNEDGPDYTNETNTYARAKDMVDFQQLKNINFNM
jgi:hypothetical protein